MNSIPPDVADAIGRLERKRLRQEGHREKPPLTRNTMATFIKDASKKMGEDFEKPEDDWLPHLFLSTAHRGMIVAALDTEFFQSEDRKDKLVNEFIVPSVRLAQARAVGMVMGAWMLMGPDIKGPDDPEYVAPSDHPDRQEVVIVQAVDKDGAEVHQAAVYRFDDRPPGLGDWLCFEQGESSGRFVDPILEALRA